MKKIRIYYWTSTIIIFLFDAVMPAFTSQTELAKSGIRDLGYPEYFGVLLTICKVIGGILLILPMVPMRIKEWAYAGFAFNFIFAFFSNLCVFGWNLSLFLPATIFAILVVSYINLHRLKKTK